MLLTRQESNTSDKADEQSSQLMDARGTALQTEDERRLWTGVTVDLMSDEEDAVSNGIAVWLMKPPAFRSTQLSQLCGVLQTRLDTGGKHSDGRKPRIREEAAVSDRQPPESYDPDLAPLHFRPGHLPRPARRPGLATITNTVTNTPPHRPPAGRSLSFNDTDDTMSPRALEGYNQPSLVSSLSLLDGLRGCRSSSPLDSARLPGYKGGNGVPRAGGTVAGRTGAGATGPESSSRGNGSGAYGSGGNRPRELGHVRDWTLYVCRLETPGFYRKPKISGKGKSTTHCLLDLTNEIFKATDKPGVLCSLVSTDYSKAFDRVNHNVAIQRLIELGLRPSLTSWVVDFLRDRRQVVRYHGTLSESMTVACGLPQGTLLGPLLFIAYINSAAALAASKRWKFVDDLNLLEARNPTSMPSSLQQDLTDLDTWSHRSDMVLHPRKCKVLHVQFSKTLYIPPPLKINNIELEQVNVMKILGLYLQSDLKWNTHIDSI
ncbi:hypothetical protein Bbelb_363940 [Branchiostoma belcheri]|nr:hypothetical protein Bbelb_363940 [Branchiostoma belcheri]